MSRMSIDTEPGRRMSIDTPGDVQMTDVETTLSQENRIDSAPVPGFSMDMMDSPSRISIDESDVGRGRKRTSDERPREVRHCLGLDRPTSASAHREASNRSRLNHSSSSTSFTGQLTNPTGPRFQNVRAKPILSSAELQAQELKRGREQLRANMLRNREEYRGALNGSRSRSRSVSSQPLTTPRAPAFTPRRERSRSADRSVDRGTPRSNGKKPFQNTLRSGQTTWQPRLTVTNPVSPQWARPRARSRSVDRAEAPSLARTLNSWSSTSLRAGDVSQYNSRQEITEPRSPTFQRVRSKNVHESAADKEAREMANMVPFKARAVNGGLTRSVGRGTAPVPKRELTHPKSPSFRTAQTSRVRGRSVEPPRSENLLAAAPFTTTRGATRLTEPKAPKFATERRARSRSVSAEPRETIQTPRFNARAAPSFAPPRMVQKHEGALTVPKSPNFRSSARQRSRSTGPTADYSNFKPAVPTRLAAAPSYAAPPQMHSHNHLQATIPVRNEMQAHDRAMQAAQAREVQVRAAVQKEKKAFSFFAKPRGSPLQDATNLCNQAAQVRRGEAA